MNSKIERTASQDGKSLTSPPQRYRLLRHLSTAATLVFSTLISLPANAQYMKVEPLIKYFSSKLINGKFPEFDNPADALTVMKASYEADVASSQPGYRIDWLDVLMSPNPPECNVVPAIVNGRPHSYCLPFNLYKGPPLASDWYLEVHSKFDAAIILHCPIGFSSNSDTISVNSVGYEVEVAQRCEKIITPVEQCKQGSCTGIVGNPINTATRAKLQRETDYSPFISGANALSFDRFYKSSSREFNNRYSRHLVNLLDGTRSPNGCYYSFTTFDSPSGASVTVPYCFPYVRSLSDPPSITAHDDDGYLQSFIGSTLTPSTGQTNDRISRVVIGGQKRFLVYKWLSGDIEEYSDSGQLINISNKSGQLTHIQYVDSSANGNPILISDQFGRSLGLTYDPLGRLSYLTLPDGLKISYQYESLIADVNLCTYAACERLSSVTYADGTTRSYIYDDAVTNPTSRRSLLTGLQDELGVRYATFSYNGDRPIGTSHAGPVNSFLISYPVEQYASVTDPLGTTRNYSYMSRQGVFDLAYIDGPACPGCTIKNQTFSDNGNVTSRVDFNGNGVCYSYDKIRNVEIARVEGLSGSNSCASYIVVNAALPATSRKTSTQWHPDWRVSIKVAEPGKITTSVYSGQPDPFNANAIASCAPASALLPDGKPIAALCREVEQATIDADGHLGFSAALQAGVPKREQTWTYNQYGQVLTHDGPRTDIADTTTYVYYADTSADHTRGDLQRVTNALGQVTNFTKYNKHGQLLQSTDPNGVTTTHSYDLRQRLLSTSVAGQTTSYSYDPVGQLKKVTQPDASWIGYDYDPAHRLIALHDNQGNRVDYTLDNAGNRIAENTKDPSGTLKRALSRSLDALGRVQQTTGRE